LASSSERALRARTPWRAGAVLASQEDVIGVDGRARGDLLNGFRAVSLRVGGMYYFGPLGRIDP
jgi:hypothetical protein